MFVSIALVALNRPWHLVFIGWRGLALVGLIKYIFGSLNWIISVWTSLTDRLNWSDRCKSVQKFGNFQISYLLHPELDLDKQKNMYLDHLDNPYAIVEENLP